MIPWCEQSMPLEAYDCSLSFLSEFFFFLHCLSHIVTKSSWVWQLHTAALANSRTQVRVLKLYFPKQKEIHLEWFLKKLKVRSVPLLHFSPWCVLSLSSALPSTPPSKKKRAFLFHAGSQLNISHIINPSNIAHPHTSWRISQSWPGRNQWGLQGHPCDPLPQRPPGHTLELSTRSFCTFSLTSKIYSTTPGLSPCLFTGGCNSGQSDSQRLGLPWGLEERSSCDCSSSQAAQNDLATTSTTLLAQSWSVPPGSQQAGYVPRHDLLSSPPWWQLLSLKWQLQMPSRLLVPLSAHQDAFTRVRMVSWGVVAPVIWEGPEQGPGCRNGWSVL